jgi:hypothetical protein
MKTSNLIYDLIDLNRALEKDIELFTIQVDLNSKSIVGHKLERIETNPDVQGRFMISKYIGNQLMKLTPRVIYPGRVSELNWRLTESFITSGQPRIIPAIIGYLHFKNDFLTDYFDSVSDISVSFIPTVSPSTTKDKLLIGVTATLYVKKIGTDPLESVDIGFINRKEVDVDENLISMDTSPNIIDYYNICFNGLTEHDQILRKKIIDELTKFI